MKYVVDTNVIVSGVLKANSKPGRILELLLDGAIDAVASEYLLAEYEEVLARPKFGFGKDLPMLLVDGIRANCDIVTPVPQDAFLSPDPKDQAIVDLAATAGAAIVTGNTKHFESYQQLLTPAEMLEQLASGR